MINIVMTNGESFEWNKTEFDDYKYDSKFFIIIRNGEWIGFYNLEYVSSIIVKNDCDCA